LEVGLRTDRGRPTSVFLRRIRLWGPGLEE
jgi:hypothetical protein